MAQKIEKSEQLLIWQPSLVSSLLPWQQLNFELRSPTKSHHWKFILVRSLIHYFIFVLDVYSELSWEKTIKLIPASTISDTVKPTAAKWITNSIHIIYVCHTRKYAFPRMQRRLSISITIISRTLSILLPRNPYFIFAYVNNEYPTNISASNANQP